MNFSLARDVRSLASNVSTQSGVQNPQLQVQLDAFLLPETTRGASLHSGKLKEPFLTLVNTYERERERERESERILPNLNADY